ncbi:MAG: hypothetical protein Unbinned400contig1004_4 [Prokaryotic dsDNA virus sp.]|nr:MAG: hypothetical protein Unbinned400contig1004_4 [Prokaryotic dsDNA virus sp.]|tara:strand:+ start:283 stop:561 length:279 start_codon:yes stop_codon:yes gene_type:complete
MIIKAVDREWEIKDISLVEKRKLQRLSGRFASQDNESLEAVEAYQDILDEVLKMSGLEELKEAHSLAIPDLDSLLQAVFENYLGIDPPTSGD